MTEQKGIIYLCGTPIGNLEDVTYRLLRTLREVDLIAAEDTRQTRKLLSFYDIHTPMTSYHQHNERFKAEELLGIVSQGRNIAVVSDAGVPGISDPGYVIVQGALEQGLTVVPIPGPSAVITALSVSGLKTERFVFEGFLSNQKKSRKQQINNLLGEERTIIFYEAPHRIKQTLKDLLEILGDRQAVVARELTKRYEQFLRASLVELVCYFENNEPKGEMVLLVEGKVLELEAKEVTPEDVLSLVESLIIQGIDKKEAIKKAAKQLNLPKREVYNQFLGKEEQ